VYFKLKHTVSEIELVTAEKDHQTRDIADLPLALDTSTDHLSPPCCGACRARVAAPQGSADQRFHSQQAAARTSGLSQPRSGEAAMEYSRRMKDQVICQARLSTAGSFENYDGEGKNLLADSMRPFSD
jgi:hypothetical protein